MLHMTSGRRGWKPYDFPDVDEALSPLGTKVKHFVASKEDRERFADLIPKDKLKEMIKRENELRVSDEYQEMYRREAELPGHVWMDVSDVIQKRVLREFGYDEKSEQEDNLKLLRNASLIHPDDAEFLTLPLYKRFNRCRDGDMKVGDAVNDCLLEDLEGNKIRLLNQFGSERHDKPLVILAGSVS